MKICAYLNVCYMRARLCAAFDFLIERVGFNLQFDKTLRNKTSAKRAQNRNDFFYDGWPGTKLILYYSELRASIIQKNS